MTKVFFGGVVVALVTFAVAGTDRVLAQSPDFRAMENLEKENAEMRKRIHRLEVERENASLHARLYQLASQRQTTQGQSPAAAASMARAEPVALSPGLVDYAGEMELKGPPLLLPPLYSWTGFYVGGNVGYSVGNDRASLTLVQPTVTQTSAADAVITPMGALGGVQFGYNWQGGPHWLFGFEADFQGSQQKNTSCVLQCINNPAGPSLSMLTAQHQLDYFGTARARLGYVNDGTLFYVTGGGAYGQVDQTLAATLSAGGIGTATSATVSESKFGYVVGGGIEAALGGNWTGKIEYLYMNLGSISSTVAGLNPPTATPFTMSATSALRDNIIRAGLNYRFGAPAPSPIYDTDLPVPGNGPLVTYAWTGPYAGANVGYGVGNDSVSQSEATTAAGVPIVIPASGNATVAPTGLIGGIQLGYNWQGGPNWLVGVEADFQGSSLADTACSPLICFTLPSAPGNPTNVITVQQQLDYFGTLRARAGAVHNNILYYGTAGVAVGHVTENVNVNSSLSTPPVFASSSSTADLIGFVVGGGIEAALWGGWTGKVEYLYMDLGSVSNALNTGTAAAAATVTTNSSIRDHIVRIGANYHL
jgi:outer membrane immunogenic protein